MICPECGAESKVVDSRPLRRSVFRRRLCLACRHRWSTFEVIYKKNIEPYPLCSVPDCDNPKHKGRGKWKLCAEHARDRDNERRRTEAYREKRRQSLKLKRLGGDISKIK